MLNPLAPPSVQGVMPNTPAGYVDVAFSYVYDFSLTDQLVLLDQPVSILTEADFLWRGLVIESEGTFAVRFQDGQQFYLSSGLIQSANLFSTAGDPFPIFPEVFYPAGGRITIDIQDTSGATSLAPNTGELLFVGVSRFRLG